MNVSRSARKVVATGLVHGFREQHACILKAAKAGRLQVEGNKREFSTAKNRKGSAVKFPCPPQRPDCNKYILTSNKTAWVEASALCV